MIADWFLTFGLLGAGCFVAVFVEWWIGRDDDSA